GRDAPSLERRLTARGLQLADALFELAQLLFDPLERCAEALGALTHAGELDLALGEQRLLPCQLCARLQVAGFGLAELGAGALTGRQTAFERLAHGVFLPARRFRLPIELADLAGDLLAATAHQRELLLQPPQILLGGDER